MYVLYRYRRRGTKSNAAIDEVAVICDLLNLKEFTVLLRSDKVLYGPGDPTHEHWVIISVHTEYSRVSTCDDGIVGSAKCQGFCLAASLNQL